jgi:flagellar biosynthesis protein FlhG
VVVDAGPGIGREVMLFCACGHDVALVMTPEPTCVSDAVQLLEALGNNGGAGVSVVVNLARTDRTGQAVFARLLDAVPQLPLRYAGSVPEDHNVRRAVHVRRPLVDVAPTSPASRAFSRLLDRLLGEVPQAPGALAQRSA